MNLEPQQAVMDTFKNAFQTQNEGQKDTEIQLFAKESWELFSNKGLPGAKWEDWRYCSFVNAYQSFASASTIISDKKLAQAVVPKDGQTIQIVNGRLVKASVKNSVSIESWQSIAYAERMAYLAMMRSRLAEERNPFALLNYALLSNAIFLYLKGDITETIKISIENESISFSYPFIFLIADTNSHSKVSVFLRGTNLGNSICNSMLCFHVKRDASMVLEMMTENIENTMLMNQLRIQQEANSKVVLRSFSTGGLLSRLDFEANLNGEGGEFDCHHLSYCKGEQQQHYFSRVKHLVPYCHSNQVFKNILADKSRISSDTLVYVEKDAKQTNSEQLIQNLFLSDTAKANTKPNLSIYHEDVKCNHGATSGSIDPESLFYLKSRGLSDAEARMMIVQSFAETVIEKLSDSQIVLYMRETIKKDVFNQGK